METAPTPPAENFSDKLRLYRPLIVIFSVSLAAGAGLALTHRVPFMDGAMGLFLLFLAVLKLFNVATFAKSFARYDLLAARVPAYGKAYPFIEVLFGILFLSGVAPLLTNGAFIVFMLIGTAGVIQTLRSGKSFICACVGTTFGLPVGRVTLVENVGMMLMAIFNLAML